jgi:hypothetical protein
MTELACAVCDRRRDGDHQLERPEMTSSGERHWLRPVATAGLVFDGSHRRGIFSHPRPRPQTPKCSPLRVVEIASRGIEPDERVT